MMDKYAANFIAIDQIPLCAGGSFITSYTRKKSCSYVLANQSYYDHGFPSSVNGLLQRNLTAVGYLKQGH